LRLLSEASFSSSVCPHDVDRGRIDPSVQMRSIVFLYHLDTGPAVLGDLVNVGAFEQAQADIGVSQARGCPRTAIAVNEKVVLFQDCIE
jgi:hypothetical protein